MNIIQKSMILVSLLFLQTIIYRPIPSPLKRPPCEQKYKEKQNCSYYQMTKMLPLPIRLSKRCDII